MSTDMRVRRFLFPAILVVLVLLGIAVTSRLRQGAPPAGPVAPSPEDLPALGRSEPPPASPIPEFVILVRDRHGQPARAEVFATGLARRPPHQADFIGETGRTGRLVRGDFLVEPRGFVFARTPGRVASPVPITPEGVELVLGDGVVVTGTVRDKEGAPLAGVLVSASRLFGETIWSASDREGRFRLTGLLPGEWGIGGRTEGFSSSIQVGASTWDETIDVELSGFPVLECSVLVEVRYSSPPEADPRMLVYAGDRVSKAWLPRADALLRVEAGEKRKIEIVCPGFKSASVRLPGGLLARESTVRLDLVAGGGMPLSILVVDLDGHSVPNALVLLTRDSDDHHPDAPRAGPDGRLALGAHLRGYLAVASASQGASERTRIEEGTDEIVLELRPAAILTGRVVDRDTGDPVPDARVRLMGGDCTCCSPWTAFTDESGEYRFAGIPAGLFVQPYVSGGAGMDGTERGQSNSHAEALARRLGHLVTGTEEARFADLHVTRYATFVCRFRIEPAVTGEQVRIERLLTGGTYFRRLGEDAVVTLELRAGEHLLQFELGGLSSIATVMAEAGVAKVEIPVHLAPPARVIAALVDSRGEPIFCIRQWVDVSVTLRADGEVHRIAWGGESVVMDSRADLTGDLLAQGPPGVENVITLGNGRFRLRGEPIRISAADLAARLREAGGEILIEIPVIGVEANPLIPVVVTDRNGQPVPGVLIGYADEPDEAVRTDEAGRADVRSGWGPLFPWTGDWDLVIRPGNEPVRVEVERARRIRLRIVDWRGEPVAGREIDDSEYRFYFGETDDDGRLELIVPARLEGLELEIAELWIGYVDLPRDADEIEVRALPRRKVEVTVSGERKLRLDALVSVGVTVVDPQGNPLKNARIIVWNQDRFRAEGGNARTVSNGRTDARGYRRLQHLPETTRHVLIISPKGSGDLAPLRIDGWIPRDSRFTLTPSRTISGRVYRADGTPGCGEGGGLWVWGHASGWDSPYIHDDGRFRVGGFAEGRVALIWIPNTEDGYQEPLHEPDRYNWPITWVAAGETNIVFWIPAR